MNCTKCQKLIKGKRRMKGGGVQDRLIDNWVYQTVCILLCHFSPQKIQSWGDEYYLESTGSKQILLNHSEYTIMFDPAVVGVGKHSANFLRKDLKGTLTSKFFIWNASENSSALNWYFSLCVISLWTFMKALKIFATKQNWELSEALFIPQRNEMNCMFCGCERV